jgi:hypothetical protein
VLDGVVDQDELLGGGDCGDGGEEGGGIHAGGGHGLGEAGGGFEDLFELLNLEAPQGLGLLDEADEEGVALLRHAAGLAGVG